MSEIPSDGPQSENENAEFESEEEASEEEAVDGPIPVIQQSIVAEFFDFIKNNKVWWMTPIIIVLLLMIAFIIFAESSPVLPFIYTVI